MCRNIISIALIAMVAVFAHVAKADETQLKRVFASSVKPFLQSFCLDCHGHQRQEAKLDLSVYSTFSNITDAHRVWEIVLERLKSNEMPPEDAKRQPTARQRREVIDWITAVRDHEAARNAGDPGPVLARRLSNAEYNYTIRDLTGVDIRPTREFPVDPANEAGFDNSGESLAISPALLDKYLDAARRIVEHLVLQPDGFAFAPHPVVTNTDRDKYCVKRIVDFYKRQPTDYADYFFAAWRFKNRGTNQRSAEDLKAVAIEEGVSAKYLKTVWDALEQTDDAAPPLVRLREMWQELPKGTDRQAAVVSACRKMRDYVIDVRRKLEPKFDDLRAGGVHKGSQSFVLWKNHLYANARMRCDPTALKKFTAANSRTLDDASWEECKARFDRFCAVFPDAFYISERGRDYLGKPKAAQEKGRLLSAGFHSMMGYFRDDAPLCELILDERQQRELDGLWQELDFITSAPMRQYKGFVWFERTDSRFMRDPQFDPFRAEDKDVTSEAKIKQLSKIYLDKVLSDGGEGDGVRAIERYFHDINAQIRWVEKAREQAEPSHLDAMLDFARRAYRRQLSLSEREDLIRYYQRLRADEKLRHEEAMQDTLVSILMSPHFFYRMDLASTASDEQPLTDEELAARLSYFLWSSMPDDPLMKRAAAKELRQSEYLMSETTRMLRDDRVVALATEFGGNWLDFRGFEQHNSVDRNRFPTFTDSLREAMFQEPIRFFVDLVRNDRSVLEFLEADHTFVNSTLAKHYGMSDLDVDKGQWVRVDNAASFGRGGVLPMSVFLTMNAPGLRTSPVKRGYWVVRRLLGERIPPPPPNVPELPSDETKLGELTLRETLAKHRAHKSCAGCHDRFDSIGLVFENFGPIGEFREMDLAGRTVDTNAVFPDGSQGDGVDELRRYLSEHRQQEFIDNLTRKLLSFALGRTLLLSDEPLIQNMKERLVKDDCRFSSLIESIVTSRQFLNKR